tara:strand:+ start:1068 stop:1382 length:315 start_codon:yes stop_codon:yes gene_type:complete
LIFSTTDTIEGRKIVEVVGVISASTVRARNIGRDITAGFRNIVGGEVSEYTSLMAQSREEALQRLQSVAESRGANAVVGMRFMTSMIAQGSAEILAYGTGVVIE